MDETVGSTVSAAVAAVYRLQAARAEEAAVEVIFDDSNPRIDTPIPHQDLQLIQCARQGELVLKVRGGIKG